MVYDYSHFAFREMTIEATIAESLPWTNYVAMKDAFEREGKVGFSLVGESGNWDVSEIVRRFYEGGYRGDFCAEVSSLIWRKDPDYDWVAATRLCFANLQAAFQKAGLKREA